METNGSLALQDQDYMVDAKVPNQALSEFWRMTKDVCGLALS